MRFPIQFMTLPIMALLLLVVSIHTAYSKDSGEKPGKMPIVSGRHVPELEPFDRLMEQFVRENEIPGAALAVTRQGRLIYARGFGFADRENGRLVQPDSLFRIASISKPLTAVATLQLVEQGKLSLDDCVFSTLPHKAHPPMEREPDPRLGKVTVAHLLRHQGGWDRDESIDPMFHSIEIASALGKSPPAGPDDIIRFMMGWPLDFDPGNRYAYSNLGYCLLGRIIENVTGRNYEAYMIGSVLQPLGIKSMRIGGTLPAKRAPGEVKYYPRGQLTGIAVIGKNIGDKVPRPYGTWSLETLDSVGGWIASAIDLVRFGSAVDRYQHSRILNEVSIQKMLTRPKGHFGNEEKGKPDKVYYGCGWSVRPVNGGEKTNRWHTGHLSGTSTLLVLRHDGLCWSVLFNTNQTADGKRPSKKIDPLVHQAADQVKAWPTHDFFPEK